MRVKRCCPSHLVSTFFVFQHLISSYLVEVCGGCDLQLHVCLFSVNAYSFEEDPPPRYASPEETATAYKEIVQAAKGRFHCFGETGALECQGVFLMRFQLPRGNPLKWSLGLLRMWAPLQSCWSGFFLLQGFIFLFYRSEEL